LVGKATQQLDWLTCLRQARQEERLRISRLLHDEVGQVLSAVGLQIELLRMDCAGLPAVAERIAETQKLLASALQEVRELSYDLDPAIVERLGLQTSLERLIRRYGRNFPGELHWRYEGDPQAQTLQAAALYRIAELALENAVRHSGASHIELQARAGADGARLEVRDNGRGFDYPKILNHSAAPGLRLMQYEAEAAGLEFRLASESEKGTIVTAWWSQRAAGPEARRAATPRAARPGRKR
jgi:signal transduction histidine kinase